MPYTANSLESALVTLWVLVEDRLTDVERILLTENGIFEELDNFGPNGPIGQGLGRFGGHAIEGAARA